MKNQENRDGQTPESSQAIIEGLHKLLEALPPHIRDRLVKRPDLDRLLEVVLDLGRPAETRYYSVTERWPEMEVREQDIEYVVRAVGEFGKDNRAGIERTLHRISAIRNRSGKIIGLTCRVGRAVYGTIDIIQDTIETGKSILIMGKPGVGKTTKLREMARILADQFDKRVVIVDTSNEIAGDGDVPHPGIGNARRMQVPEPARQHEIMVEAVENHMPEVIVIDEIGTEAEALAARTIAERGVQLIGTAHGISLENLLSNPTLCDLVGGIQAVTLSDDEARRRGTQKTVLERKAPPTFDVVIELLDYDKLALHHDVQRTVDLLLRGTQPRPEIRVKTPMGEVEIVQKPEAAAEPVAPAAPERRRGGDDHPKERRPVAEPDRRRSILRVFPYGVARTRLERAIRERRYPASICNDIEKADAILAIKTTYQRKPIKLQEAVDRKVPMVVVKSNTYTQIAGALDELFQREEAVPLEDTAVREAQAGVEAVLESAAALDLTPRNSYLRRIQHLAIAKMRLTSESVGEEPERYVRILPIYK
jgi:stage III sporulation protein SpoIIIAA